MFRVQDAKEDPGRIGLVIVFAGMIGSVACGMVLDRYHRFKWVNRLSVTFPIYLPCSQGDHARRVHLLADRNGNVHVRPVQGDNKRLSRLRTAGVSAASFPAVARFNTTIYSFFMTGLLPVGFELAAELTYPEPEGTSAGLLNATSQVFGIAFTSIYSAIFYWKGDFIANMVMSGMLLVGTIFTAFVSKDMRRQAAAQSGNKQEVVEEKPQ